MPVTTTAAVLAALATLSFIYPYVLYPLSLLCLPGRPVKVGSGDSDGSGFTLAFCAFNEAKAVPEKLENLSVLRQRYPAIEILAYDDGSTDGTFELLAARPELLTVVRGAGRRGKAHGMKELVGRARGDYVVFTDANVLLDPECVAQLRRYYADSSVGGVCGSLRYIGSNQGTATEASGGLYWRLEERIKTLESMTGNVMGADGSIFSVRKDLYPESFPDTVQDDFTVSMSVIFGGARLIKAPEVIAHERLVSERADEVRRKVRIAARARHTHTFLKPGLRSMPAVDRYKYFAHKMLRWWGAVPALFAAAAMGVILLSQGTAGVLAVAALVAASLLMRLVTPRIADFAIDLAVAVLATFRGMLKGCRGETFVVWTPPATR